MTPSRLPNRASGPQNQPIAKVAISVLAGLEVSIGGIVVFLFTIGLSWFEFINNGIRISPAATINAMITLVGLVIVHLHARLL